MNTINTQVHSAGQVYGAASRTRGGGQQVQEKPQYSRKPQQDSVQLSQAGLDALKAYRGSKGSKPDVVSGATKMK